MQTVETLNEGLKRAYTLKITAQDIDSRVDAELKRVAPTVKMPGFRPGKVPANLVRKMHGPALLQDALNSSIQEGIQGLIAEQRLRPAVQPSVSLADGYEPGKDADVQVALEVLPDVPAPVIDGLKLERLTVPADEAAVDAQLAKFAEQQKSWDEAPAEHEAAMGDLVVMDFAGKVGTHAFEGGTGTDMAVELGTGRLIPGFEEQVVGAKTGEERTIAVTFPADYQAAELAGKDATFDLKVTAVKTSAETRIDDDLAKSLGLESLEQFTGLLKGQIEQELNGLTRTYMKRKLLDQLAEGHDFEVPPSMVEAEFAQIWSQLEHEASHEQDPAAALAEMEAERDDYRRIAERRVRLGLLLSEIGQANGVEVTQAEMNRLIAQAAQQYNADDRQRFLQYIQQEPMAAAQLRAPLYEDKVVDWLFERAEITDREVTREELEAAIESDEGFATGTHSHDHDNHKPKGKKGKASAEPDAAPDGASDTALETAPDTTEVADSEAAPQPASPVKKAATRKAPAAAPAEPLGAPIEAETQLLESSPVAADAPVKKPRAKKPKTEG